MSLVSVISGSDRSVPNAPTIGTATDVGTARAFNNGAATVTFTAPTFDGRLPITSYTVTSSPGGFTASGASSPLTVTGLQSSTSYTFTVTATNAVGTSAASGATASITATTVPQAPTIGTATAGNASATVAYTAGATGGKAVSTYTATSTPGSLTGTGASPITVSGLTNGTAYTFKVKATNANGTSLESAASNSVTPVVPFTYLLTTQNNPNNNNYNNSYGVGIDSSGNFHTAGRFGDSFNGVTAMLTTKYNSAGVMQWKKTLRSSGITNIGYAGALDSSANVYNVGYTNQSGTNDVLFAKYNSSGTLQWQKRLGGAGSDVGYGVTVDSSGNIYIAGTTGDQSGSGRGIVAKYNSSGTLQWQKNIIPNLTSETSAYCITVDSSGNVYVGGMVSAGSAYDALIIKLDSSGTILWQRSLAGATNTTDTINAITVDSSGNVYITGYGYSFTDTFVMKYNSSGTLQWQRKLTISSDYGTGISTDSSANVYVTIRGGSSNTFSHIVKYNTSGTIQWQRKLSASVCSLNAIKVDSSGNIYAAGEGYSTTGSSTLALTAVLPTDGSKTGTYSVGGNSYVYATGTMTDSDGTWTESTPSHTVGTITYTDAATTLTDSTPTTTISLLVI
jgi:outer membrane protein assembly factor BamB